MTWASCGRRESPKMRGWRVVRGFEKRVLDCTPMKRRLAKSGARWWCVGSADSATQRKLSRAATRASTNCTSSTNCNYRSDFRTGQHRVLGRLQ
jgi:hypothetical protein